MWTKRDNDVVLWVKVIPNAKSSQFMGYEAGKLKIRLNANPEKGEANAELIHFLSKALGCTKVQVEILSGQTSRHKKLLIRDYQTSQLEAIFGTPPLLETSRLIIRRYVTSDIDHLHRIFSDPIAMRYYPKPFTLEESRNWLTRFISDFDLYGMAHCCCFLKTGEFVGTCGLIYRPNFEGQDEVEIGYLFLPAYWGKGLATEAAMAFRDYALGSLAKKRVISLIRPENIPSIKVAERLGFRPEKQIMYKGITHIVYTS
ncbi:MAG: GNAT family N-acetyltransferase [Waddliaceae bacterium]